MTQPALGPIARAGAGLARPPSVSFEFSPPKTEEAEASLAPVRAAVAASPPSVRAAVAASSPWLRA